MSDSSSEDENIKNLLESVDTDLINDSFFKKTPGEVEKNEVPTKSQRHLEEDGDVFKSDLNISKSMQDFISKKLSKLIDDQIEFVEVKKKKIENQDSSDDSLRLLKGSKHYVKLKDPEEEGFLKNRKKVPILKRKIEDNEISESKKCKSIAVNIQNIQEEVGSWTNRSKAKVFDYKIMKSVGYLKEPTNEFTKIRNKNSWSESKIAKTKCFGKGLQECLKEQT